MHIAGCVTKATDTHSEYVILFPLQQQSRERVSVLGYTVRTLLVLLNVASLTVKVLVTGSQ